MGIYYRFPLARTDNAWDADFHFCTGLYLRLAGSLVAAYRVRGWMVIFKKSMLKLMRITFARLMARTTEYRFHTTALKLSFYNNLVACFERQMLLSN